MENKKYLVQATLKDGNLETVMDSVKTDSFLPVLHKFMKRHVHSYRYTYTVMVINTGHLMFFDNIFQVNT